MKRLCQSETRNLEKSILNYNKQKYIPLEDEETPRPLWQQQFAC